ncbi:hypothetical protein [Streptomyces sp. NPDC007917]|uniref:hypothetical protein n=1 Tax=Streptomyces sp. NPDC007917 TaxID=3364793 RepID=UPI0036F08861
MTTPYPSDAPPSGTVDAVVIGGRAAGLNGELMLARSRRPLVVIDSGTPRNAPAEAMHGFIGRIVVGEAGLGRARRPVGRGGSAWFTSPTALP